MRRARNAIPAESAVAASYAVAVRALPLVAALGAPETTPVALYCALPGELDCAPLLQALAAAGFPTLLPVAGEKARPLDFRLWKPGDPLARGRFGLREPAAGAPPMTPKILLAPLLGFDGRGNRLGFGGGYYDATLAHLRAGGLTAAGGLAFSLQKIDAIPVETHDAPLDFVVTENELHDFHADR